MNINEVFQSKYLKASDITSPVPAVISLVQMELIGMEQKPVMYLQDHQKGVVMNKTNLFAVGSKYGQETTGWPGQVVTITTAPTTTPTGEPTVGIRVLPLQQQPMQTAVMHQDGQIQQPAPPNVGFVPNQPQQAQQMPLAQTFTAPAPTTLATAQGQQTPAASIFTQPGGQPGPQQVDERNPPPAVDDEIPF